MKKLKAILALVLVACLFVAMFAACAKTEAPADNKPGTSETPKTETPKEETPKTDAPKEEAPAADEELGEPIELVFTMRDFRTKIEFADEAIQALHDLVLDEINVDLKIELLASAEYNNRVNLGIAGGEQLDLVWAGFNNNVAGLYASKMIQPITEYVNEYAAEALDLVKDYIGTYTYGGEIYGLPTLRNYCKNGYISMNGAMLEEMGLTEKARNMKSFSEFEEIMQAVKDQYPEMYPWASSAGMFSDAYVSGADAFSDYIVYDNLGDTLSQIYCMDNKCEAAVFLDVFEQECARTADWFQKGYIWPDSLITTEVYDDLMKQGVCFANSFGSEYGVEATKSLAYGFPAVCTQICPGMVKTNQPVSHGCCVPVTCEDPEAACKLINLFYTNADAMNLLINGVEGKDYEVVNGEAVHGDNTYFNVDFLFGNALLLTPLAGNGADFYKKVEEINHSAVISDYMGFAFDSTGTDDLRANITAVNDQYRKNIVAGGYTPEAMQEYRDKLVAAGIDEYVALFQEQLDAWLAANK